MPLADVVGAVVAGPQQRGEGRVAGLQTAQVTWRVDSVDSVQILYRYCIDIV